MRGWPLVALQQRLRHRFADPRLLQRALTHRSFGADHNERLEFLGDAVLNLAVSAPAVRAPRRLRRGRPDPRARPPGREDSLHRVARRARPARRAAPGRRRGAWRRRQRAVDPGRRARGADRRRLPRRRLRGRARRWCAACSARSIDQPTDGRQLAKDAKTELQEWLQARKHAAAGLPRRRHARRRPTRRPSRSSARSPTLGLRERGDGALAPRRRAGGRAPHAAALEGQGATVRCDPAPRIRPPWRQRDAGARALRPGRDRRQAQRRQVDPAERAGRPEDQHHLAQGADHAAPHHRHPHRRRDAVRLRRHAGLPDPARHRAEPLAQQDRASARWPTSTWCCSSSRPASSRSADAKVLALLKPGMPALLVANKLDQVHRRADLAPWLQDDAAAPRLRRVRADVGQERRRTSSGCSAICEKYLPEQPWLYDADALTDRSEQLPRRRDRAREAVPPDRRRAALHLHRGRSTSSRKSPAPSTAHGQDRRHHRRRARRPQGDGHRRQGERLKRIGTEARQELEKLIDCQGVPRALGQGALAAGPTTRRACAASAMSERQAAASPAPRARRG